MGQQGQQWSMALHLVFTDKQQIISKSQQPCVVRFLQEPTSISLQPASPPAPLPLLFFPHPVTALLCLEHKHVHVCVSSPQIVCPRPVLSRWSCRPRKQTKRETRRTLRGNGGKHFLQMGTGCACLATYTFTWQLLLPNAVFHPGATFALEYDSAKGGKKQKKQNKECCFLDFCFHI